MNDDEAIRLFVRDGNPEVLWHCQDHSTQVYWRKRALEVTEVDGWETLPPVKARPDWQTIETAPRDGTEFLGYAASVGKFDVCRWSEDSIHSIEPGKRGCYETVQHDGEYGPEDDEFGYWDATHWMPLPAPPTA